MHIWVAIICDLKALKVHRVLEHVLSILLCSWELQYWQNIGCGAAELAWIRKFEVCAFNLCSSLYTFDNLKSSISNERNDFKQSDCVECCNAYLSLTVKFQRRRHNSHFISTNFTKGSLNIETNIAGCLSVK